MLHRSFKPAKCKTSLKLAVARLKLLKNKREVQVRQMKKDLAHLLETGQEKTAMIRVEHVVREEKTMAAYDFIDIYCELIAARLPIIESQKICPIDLKEAISSLIFAAPRCADIPELVDVRKHFTAKYGKDFITSALELRPNCGVNRMVVENLSARAPDGQTKLKILTEVAKEHNVKWDAEAFGEKEVKPPEDLLKPMEPPVSHVPSYGQGPDRANFEASTIHTPAKPDTSGGLAEGSKYTRPSSQNSNEFAPNRQNWTMDFKDATSAAQAAAESAEKASLAARAAAEFANLGMGTGQYSMGSQEPMMRDQQRYRNERESMQGVSDSMLESQNVQRRYSNSASSVSGVSNIEGDSNRTHKYQQKSPFDVDIDNNGRQTKKPEKTNSQSTQIGSVDHLQHVMGSGHTDSVGEGVRRQLSGSYSSSSDDNGDVRSVSDLPKYGSDGGDNLFNSNTDRGNMQSGAKQPSFDRYSSVIFDEPVSEDETTENEFGNPSQDANSTSQVSENRNNLSPNRKSGGSPSYDDYSSVVFDEPVFDDTTVHKYGYSDTSPGKNSISQFSEYRSTSSPGRDRVEVSEETPRTQSLLFRESRSPAEFTESITKTSSSQSADILPATFDDSDGIESESEEETSKPDFSGRTESVDQLPRTNSFNRSPESPEKVRPNIPERMVKVVNRKPWIDSSSDDSDFDSEEPKRHNTGTVSRIKNHELGDSFNVKSSYRHTETANRLAGNKAKSYSPPPVFEEKQQSKQSSRYSLDQNVKSGGDSLALGSSDEVQDGGELDLGRLRGGFRNKGYIRPPYRKQQQTDDSNDGQVKSSGVRTKTNTDTLDQDGSSHNQQLRAPRELRSNNSRATFESENDETEGSPPQISGSRYKLGSRLSRRTRDSASDVSSPSASTSRSRMEKIPDRDELHPKSSLSEVNQAKNSDIPAKSTGSWWSSRTNISKQNPDPQPQSRQTNLPVEHQPSKQTGRPIRDDNLKSSQSSVVEDSSGRPDGGSGKADILKQSSLGKEPVSRENSLKKASHVHPKLPDYDSFAAHFQNMRSSR